MFRVICLAWEKHRERFCDDKRTGSRCTDRKRDKLPSVHFPWMRSDSREPSSASYVWAICHMSSIRIHRQRRRRRFWPQVATWTEERTADKHWQKKYPSFETNSRITPTVNNDVCHIAVNTASSYDGHARHGCPYRSKWMTRPIFLIFYDSTAVFNCWSHISSLFVFKLRFHFH